MTPQKKRKPHQKIQELEKSLSSLKEIKAPGESSSKRPTFQIRRSLNTDLDSLAIQAQLHGSCFQTGETPDGKAVKEATVPKLEKAESQKVNSIFTLKKKKQQKGKGMALPSFEENSQCDFNSGLLAADSQALKHSFSHNERHDPHSYGDYSIVKVSPHMGGPAYDPLLGLQDLSALNFKPTA